MKYLTKLTIVSLLFLTTSCQMHKDWRLKTEQDNKKIFSMNTALEVCNSAKQWTDTSSGEYYDRYYQPRAKSEEMWEQFRSRGDLLYKGVGTRGNKTSYRDMINDCDKLIGDAFTIYSIDKKMTQESEDAKNLGYPSGIFGYQDKNYNAGITNFINYIYNASKQNSDSTLVETIKKNKWFLIRANDLDRNFKVNGIITESVSGQQIVKKEAPLPTKILSKKGKSENVVVQPQTFITNTINTNYVLYRYFSKEYQLVQVALIGNDKESYLENSPLIGKYFSVEGTKKFNVDGKILEVLVIKRVK